MEMLIFCEFFSQGRERALVPCVISNFALWQCLLAIDKARIQEWGATLESKIAHSCLTDPPSCKHYGGRGELAQSIAERSRKNGQIFSPDDA